MPRVAHPLEKKKRGKRERNANGAIASYEKPQELTAHGLERRKEKSLFPMLTLLNPYTSHMCQEAASHLTPSALRGSGGALDPRLCLRSAEEGAVKLKLSASAALKLARMHSL